MADCEQRNMPSVNWKKRRIKKKKWKINEKNRQTNQQQATSSFNQVKQCNTIC